MVTALLPAMPDFLAPGLGLAFCLLVLTLLLRTTRVCPRRSTVPLRGPPSTSWLFGAMKTPAGSSEAGSLYEKWAEEYGSAYDAPCGFGQSCLVLCDPKAIQHFYVRETWGYVHTSLIKTFTERLVSQVLIRLLILVTVYLGRALSLLGRRRDS